METPLQNSQSQIPGPGNTMDMNETTSQGVSYQYNAARCKGRLEREQKVTKAVSKRWRLESEPIHHIKAQDVTRRLATSPPVLPTPILSKQEPRSESLDTEVYNAASIYWTVMTIPSVKHPNIAIILSNSLILKADRAILRKACPFFHNQLWDEEKSILDSCLLKGIVGAFALPMIGKPILQRISKLDANEIIKRHSLPSWVDYESRVSSNPAIIKQEPGAEVQSQDITTQSALTLDTSPSILDQDAHVTLLYLLHNQDPPKHTQGFQYTLKVAKCAIDLAGMGIYDCVHVLKPRLAVSLHQYRHELFLAIKEDPPRFAMIASVLEDQSIMTKALIHMVGCSPIWPETWTLHERLEKRQECGGVLVTVQRKAGELRRQGEILDRHILVNTLTIDGSQRIDLTRNPESWVVTQLHRCWFANEIDDIHLQDEEQGIEQVDPLLLGDIARKLRQGGDEYLPILEVFKSFDDLKLGYDAKEVIEDLDLLKSFAQDAVATICQNRLMLDPVENGIGYLTCVEIGENDMPWINKAYMPQ